jgi:hypothetical protein
MQAFADSGENEAANGNCRKLIGLQIADAFGRSFAIRNSFDLRITP